MFYFSSNFDAVLISCNNRAYYISEKNSMSPIRFDPHCVQTDPAKYVWTRAYLIPERNRTVRRQEEGNNSVYLFVFLHELGGNKCFINHFLLSDEIFWLCHRILIEK